MRRLALLFFAALLAGALSAAEVTDVADSFDENNPFDFNLNVYYKNTHEFADIKREYNTIPQTYDDGTNTGGVYYTTESRRVETLEYSGNPEVRYLRELMISSEIGLYHDLSLSVDVPIVLKDAYKLLIENYDLDGAGNIVPRPYSLLENNLFPDAGDLYYNHMGVGDIGIGVQWAPFNQERGKDAFSWLVGFKTTFPTAAIATPKNMNRRVDTNGDPITGTAALTDTIEQTRKTGGVGKGLYTFDIRTAVAKRYDVAEPYFQVLASLSTPSANSIVEKARHEFTLNLGADLYAFEQIEKGHKIFFRLDLGMQYTTRGNAYNYITDARWVYEGIDPDSAASYGWILPAGVDKNYHLLPLEDPYFTATGLFKMNFKIFHYVQFGGYVSVGYRHKHYLSAALEDTTGAGDHEPGFVPGIDSESTPWIGAGDVDSKSGGRLLTEANIIVGWGAYLSLMF